jgi:hypothetical protein
MAVTRNGKGWDIWVERSPWEGYEQQRRDFRVAGTSRPLQPPLTVRFSAEASKREGQSWCMPGLPAWGGASERGSEIIDIAIGLEGVSSVSSRLWKTWGATLP